MSEAMPPEGYPSYKQDKYVLRFSDGMRDHLKEAAAANNRSMNAEIVARLEDGAVTLRDKFAMSALAGILTVPGDISYSSCAKVAYLCADAMLAEMSK